MAKSRKKSKEYYSDSSEDEVDSYVKKEINKAMNQVNKAMKEANLARKEGKKAREAARKMRNASLEDDDDIEEDAEPTGVKDETGREYRDYKKGGKGGKDDKGKSGGTYHQHNTFCHKGTMINIQNAQNVQVGHNNLMVVTDQKFARPRKTSQPRDTTEEDRKMEEDERRQRDVEVRFKDVLESTRLATVEDFEKACIHVEGWRRFLRVLGLSDGEIDHLHQDYYVLGVREVMIQGARLWQQKTTDRSKKSLSAFASILLKLKQFDAIEALKVDYRQNRQTAV